MNEYWSNDDDKKVSYVTERPLRNPRAAGGVRPPAQGEAPAYAQEDPASAFTVNRELQRREPRYSYTDEPSYTPNYGSSRSTFISQETQENGQEDMRFAPPPKFTSQPPPGMQEPEYYAYGDGYQVHTEQQPDPRNGGGRKHGWLISLIVLLVLLLIGSGAYIFRYQVLDLVGNVFGEEVVWKIMPTATPMPTEAVQDVPAYVESTTQEIKTRSMQEINAVAGGLDMTSYAVTGSSIVMQAENPNGGVDYYLFSASDGRLLGYYEGITQLIPCADSVFYLNQPPYLVTSEGFPLVDLSAFERSTGGPVVLRPMINGWALISDQGGTMYNYINEGGTLISDLWFAKAFPFTGETTLAYLDTGNVSSPDRRYALYLLTIDGETRRITYTQTMDEVLESVGGIAFMENGEVRTQDEDLSPLTYTDDAAAYVNCGALVLRDPQTQLYALYVDGVEQYSFAFDSIVPMSSDLEWVEDQTGYVRRYTAAGHQYPLPRSYSFILQRGDTQQVVSIAASSEFPIVFE